MQTFMTMTLTEEEESMAVEGGTARQERAKLEGRKDRHGFDGDPLAAHILGVAGEIVASKLMGHQWTDTPYRRGECDLPYGLEVKTRSHHGYELMLWPENKSDRTYIFVTKEKGDPIYRIHGFATGDEVKKPCWKKQVTTRPASYFFPQSELHSIQEFVKEYRLLTST